MDKITLQQISELSDKEQRQLKACVNDQLGRQFAAQQRRKKIMKARMEMEFEPEPEPESEDYYEC